ncbi:lasso peptide biosynthesis B2 protein [Streptomyces sp. NPDC058861]|uniref:lasso peptide biosynthesis B2 protein n=1 Tax=Streptomyces sp. NPDC058861 TaxID=3346653 RepID=UPI0036AE33A8
MKKEIDLGHVLVVINYSTGRVGCQIPSTPSTTTAPSASWGSTEHPAGLTRPSGPWTPAAVLALAVVFAAKRAGRQVTTMQRVLRIVRAANSITATPATYEQATAAVEAVRRVAWFSPGRTACLEESAAAVVLLALRGRSAVWCHGVAPDPIRLHAWLTTDDGTPVAEPASTNAYTIALTIGATHD